MKGYLWGLSSVALATLAQLLMKWGMMQLPMLAISATYLQILSDHLLPLSMVILGVLCYLFSMLCWFFTLRYLPLNRAYPLISISYVLVYLATLLLPWFNEPATLLKTLAIGSILFGIWLINSQPKSA